MRIIYNNFRGGFNDTSTFVNTNKGEVSVAENVDLESSIKGFRTRKGNTIHKGPIRGITDAGEFMAGGEIINYCIKDNVLYREIEGVLYQRLLSVGSNAIYPFRHNNKLYFTNGSTYYVWGEFDYSSETGTVSIETGDIVLNLGSSGGGEAGSFYKALDDFPSLNLGLADYSNETNWEEVTEIPNKTSSVIREVEPYDGGRTELATLEVFKGCSTTGNASIFLDGVEFSIAFTAGDSIDAVVDKIYATIFTGWTVVKSGNKLTFECNTIKLVDNGYFDEKNTGITAVLVTERNGKNNDNDITPIKKCTMFLVHPTSMRVFAAGNPESPDTLYFSDIGNPAYFSVINRLVPIQGEGDILSLVNLHDAVLLSYKTGWYKWRGIEVGTDAEWKSLSLPNGAVNNNCVALTPYSLMFLSDDGLYRVNASIISEDTTMIASKGIIKNVAQDKVMTTLSSITNKVNAVGVYHNNKYLLAYCDDNTGVNNRVLEYSLDNDGFTLITGWRVDKWLKSNDGNLYFLSGNYILKAFEEYTDTDISTGFPTAIPLSVEFENVDLGNPITQKLVRFITVVAKKSDQAITIINEEGFYFPLEVFDPGIELSKLTRREILDAKITIEIETSSRQNVIREITLSDLVNFPLGKIVEKRVSLAMLSDYFKIKIYSNEVIGQAIIAGIAVDFEVTKAVNHNVIKVEELLL